MPDFYEQAENAMGDGLTLAEALQIVRDAHSSLQADRTAADDVGRPDPYPHLAEFDLRHGLAVAGRVDGPAAKLVALLHDALEDGACTVRDLADAQLPPAIFDAILALTRQPDEKYANYVTRVLRSDPLVRAVKSADLTVNLERMDDEHASLAPRYKDALARLAEAER